MMKRTIVAVIIMITTAVFLEFISSSEAIQPKKAFDHFPLQIGEWRGEVSRFDDKIYEVLGVDDSILSNYRAKGGKPVQLYVGYYRSQKEGDLIHSPKNCMPGGGWNITDVSIEALEFPDRTHGEIDIIKLILEKGDQKQVTLYWFQSRGRFISSEYWQKIYLVIDSITKHRTDGSFVRLISPITISEETTTEYMKDFARLLIPILREYIPS